MQRQVLTARDEVFASGDLVYLLKDCFTKNNFALNRAFVRFAKKSQLDIRPVALRAHADPRALHRAVHAFQHGRHSLKICDIEWPVHVDPTEHPTASFDLLAYFTEPFQHSAVFTRRIVDLMLMTHMLHVHAPHVRRLKIDMALNVLLTDATDSDPAYEHLNSFLAALARCTAMETLTIFQTDYHGRDAKPTTVQCRLFHIINTMQNLKVLDFNGNMTVEAAEVAPEGVPDQATLFDYLPPSLCELTIRDGPLPRMNKFKEFYGFSAGLKLAMGNYDSRTPSLKKISLPSSFWSLPPHQFGGFMRALNRRQVTHIGFADDFAIMTGPTKLGLTMSVLPAPYLMLHFLLATLTVDMVVDLRGGAPAERAARIQWAMDYPQTPQTSLTSFLSTFNQRSDGEDCTTVTMRKKNNTTVRVLV